MTDYNYKNFKTKFYDLANFPGPKAGEKLIDLHLYDINGKQVMLSGFLDKPIVLETGSITCPMYAKCIPKMENLKDKFPNVGFLLIYVREAHPGERTTEHRTLKQKINLATKTKKLYGENRVILIDNLNGDFHLQYGGLPDMLYIINTEGTVVFRGDWNNPAKVSEVLSTLNKNRIITEEHFEPAKPNPFIMLKALSQGGFIAIWDLIKGIPGLLRLHKKANEAYK